jgi:hypothetical protein
MPRIRTLKPTIWTDERFIELSRDARLLLIGMISHADDEGRIVASAAALIGAIYPHDDVTVRQVERWRSEIADGGLVTVYQNGRGTYAAFPGWRKHQYIQKPSPSTLPAPDVGDHTPRGGTPAGPRRLPPSGSRSGRGSGSRSDSGSGPEVEVEVEVDKEVEVVGTETAPARPRPRAVS